MTPRLPGRFRLTRRSGVVLVACFTILLSSCSRWSEPSDRITIESEVSPRPARTGRATITLRIKDASGKPVTGARVAMEGNMSHAGMAPEFGDAKEIEPGRYQGPLELSMAGDWIVLVHLTLANGVKLERQFAIPGVHPD